LLASGDRCCGLRLLVSAFLPMTAPGSPFEGKTDSELHDLAQSSDFRAVVEAMRRFRVASDKWSSRLLLATYALLAATAVILVLTLVLVMKTP
jgi:hypothetical protein